MTIEDIKAFNSNKSLQDLELQLETARLGFFRAVVKPETREMVTKYLNAYTLASDMYYARKWNK